MLEAKRTGRLAYIPSLEAAMLVDDEIDRLAVLHRFGLRWRRSAESESSGLGGGAA